MDPTVMQKVMATPDTFLARLIAARLGAEGIVCEIRGEQSIPYPMGINEVWVEATQLTAAREILTLEEAVASLDPSPPLERPSRVRAALVVIGLVVLPVVAFARVYFAT